MSSSTDSADNTSTCVVDKEGDDSIEDVAVKQLNLKIENLSIEKKEGVVMSSTDNAENIDDVTICAACGKEGEEDNMNICISVRWFTIAMLPARRSINPSIRRSVKGAWWSYTMWTYLVSPRCVKSARYACYPCHLIRLRQNLNHAVAK